MFTGGREDCPSVRIALFIISIEHLTTRITAPASFDCLALLRSLLGHLPSLIIWQQDRFVLVIRRHGLHGVADKLGHYANRAATMKPIEYAFQEFIDAIHTADDESEFARVAARLTQRLGFRWFAYLRLIDDAPTLISSYPKSWTDRYFDLGYQQLDPVVLRARGEQDLFSWGGKTPRPAGSREQRRFFDEAMTFGIRSGITVPIRGGFGRMAAFTLATDEPIAEAERLLADARDVVQLAGLYFHTHATTRLVGSSDPPTNSSDPPTKTDVLTQRERQCLAWVARGKTVADTAILIDIAPRTVVFHLENARRKLDAASIAQCVAEALRRGLLP
jgi:LuxR family transcriptional regulator, activator of conjugal transfer of Ti plasmids